MKFEDDEFAEFQNAPNPRGDALRRASERWVLTGLDPSITSLANTSLKLPPPIGTVEETNQGPGVKLAGEPSQSKFVGPGFPERHFMFAVFALCDGNGVDRAAAAVSPWQRTQPRSAGSSASPPW